MPLSKSQSITGLVATLATVVAGMWIYSNLESYEKTVTVGPSAKARRNPLLAAERFVANLGYETESVSGRSLLNQVPDVTHTLIVNSFFVSLSAAQEAALFRWIDSGGHLILAPQKNWNDDKNFKSYGFFEKLNIRRLKSPKRIVPVSFQYQPEGPEITVQFQPFWLQYQGEQPPVFAVSAKIADPGASSSEDYHLIQLRYGAGLITVSSDMAFLSNSRIGQHDHAFFLGQLVTRNPGKVWLLYDNQTPSLVALIWQNGKNVLIPLVIAAMLWIRKIARRCGPIRRIEDYSQRSILEQLDGKAHYLWRNRAYEKAIYPNQQWLLSCFQRQYPALSRFSKEQQLEWISRFSDMNKSEVELALFGKVERDDELINQTIVFEKLERIFKLG